MNMQPSLTKCCFCVPLRYGLLIWAYIRLVFNICTTGCTLFILFLLGIILLLAEYTTYILILLLSAMMLFFTDIFFNFVLIVGCHKKHTTLLRLYFRYGIVYAIIFVIMYATVIAFKLTTDDRPHSEKDTWTFIAIFSSICGILLILHMYLLLMVHSEILRLKQPSSQLQFVNRIAEPSLNQLSTIK